MINYLLSSFIAISFIFQLDPDFNEAPLKKEMEQIDNIVFTNTLFHTVEAQHYTLSDFHCSLYYVDTNLRKIDVFGISPHALYMRTYYFEKTDIFAVVEQRFGYKNYSFLNRAEIKKLNVEKAKQLDSLVSFEVTNYYYQNDSLIGLSGSDIYLLDQPRMMYNQANNFLIYYEKNLKRVADQ